MRPDCEAAERNKGPIADVLARWLPPRGVALEVASGSGQHVSHFARRFPGLSWQPSDPDPAAREAIEARRRAERLDNVGAPLDLDVCASPWPIARADAVVCINMLHVAPWEAGLALLAGAARVLPAGGCCAVYGPFAVDGAFNSEGNARFDADLRRRDASYGLRDLQEVIRQAEVLGLASRERADMPANNFTLIFTRR